METAALPINDPSNFSRRQLLKNLSLTSLALFTGSTASASSLKPGIEGHKMPKLEAEFWIDGEGNKTLFNMDELSNKWVFIKCFQNWCPGCHKTGFPTLKAVYDAFGKDNRVAILAIQTVFEGHFINRGSALREMQTRYELPVKMGHDPGDESSNNRSKNMQSYRTGGTPWLIVANPQGIVVYNHYQNEFR